MKFELIQLFSMALVGLATLPAPAGSVYQDKVCDRSSDLLLKTRDGFQVDFKRYGFPGLEKAEKLIVILPPTGGLNPIDKMYAREFCRRGYLAIILKGYSGHEDIAIELGIHETVLKNLERSIRLLRSRYTQEFFGLLGTSAGGIAAATLVDNRQLGLDAIFTIVAGAPLHSVIARAGEDGLADLRKQRMVHFNFETLDEYERALREALSVKIPEQTPRALKVGMVVATRDTVVPTELQLIFRDLWKPDFLLSLPREHTAAILWTASQHSLDIVEFFDSARRAVP